VFEFQVEISGDYGDNEQNVPVNLTTSGSETLVDAVIISRRLITRITTG